MATVKSPSRYQRVRAACDRFIHHPVVELVIVVLIVASVVVLVLETVYDRAPRLSFILAMLGDGLTWLFIVELSIRFWVARKKRRFFRRYWLDIFAVLPLARPLRVFRAVRLLRLFRAGLLLNRRLTVFGGALRGALNELTLLGTITAILVLASAVILYLNERHNPDFSTMEGTLWYSVYSLIGGEPIGGTPSTEAGRGVTLTLMVGGLTIFGIFVGTISAAMMSRLSKRMDVNEMDLDELRDHIVVGGWNASGRQVLGELFGGSAVRQQAVVLITDTDAMPDDVPRDVVRGELLYHVPGDYTKVEVLERANVKHASAAILLSDRLAPRPEQDRDARTVLAALTIEKLSPGIFTCAELCNRENASLLEMAGVEEIVVPEEYSGVIMGSVSRNRGLVRVLDEILTTRYGNAFHKLPLPERFVGKTVGELHHQLKQEHNAILVSIEHPIASGDHEVVVNPSPDTALVADTLLVVISEELPKL